MQESGTPGNAGRSIPRPYQQKYIRGGENKMVSSAVKNMLPLCMYLPVLIPCFSWPVSVQ